MCSFQWLPYKPLVFPARNPIGRASLERERFRANARDPSSFRCSEAIGMNMAGVVVAVCEDSDSMYNSVMWVIVKGTYAQYAFVLQSNGECLEQQRIALNRTGTICEDMTTLATLCLWRLRRSWRQVTQLLTSKLFPARSTPVQCQNGAFVWSGGAVFVRPVSLVFIHS